MKLPVTYVFTHDSIGLGEDGPTHQPVEHLAALRAIPNLTVIRPADSVETAQAGRMTFIGGSADLAPSNNTYLKGLGDVKKSDFSGRNLHFGVREHAMGGILNGMALHGGANDRKIWDCP